MDSLENNEKIVPLLHLLEDNGRQGQAEEVIRLLRYVDSLEQQYTAVLSELQEIKGQLSEVTDRQHPFKTQLQEAVQTAETKLEQVQGMLTDLKERLIAWAETAADDFKRFGVAALDKAVSALGIKHLLEGIRDKLDSSIKDIRTSISQVETVGQELRDAGSHLSNARRAAAGKDLHVKDTSKEGRFQKVVLAPMRGVNKLMTGMRKTAHAAISKVERLETKAEQACGKREKVSVRQRLRNQTERPALPPPKDREKKKSDFSR